MSMNLAFVTVKGGYQIDFPFQTPTSLSYAVRDAKSVQERLDLIEAELTKWRFPLDEMQSILSEIETKLKDTSLRLVVI